MAKNTSTEPAKKAAFDIKSFLPEGFSLDGLRKVGGLRPIVTPALCREHPVAGKIITLLDMPDRDDGSKWQALLIELTHAAKGIVGEEEADVEAGKEVLIPVSGSLRVNADLLSAAVDPARVHFAVLHVSGEMDTGKPSPMAVFDAFVHDKTWPREGKYALHNQKRVTSPTAKTSDGATYNQETGEIIDEPTKNGAKRVASAS